MQSRAAQVSRIPATPFTEQMTNAIDKDTVIPVSLPNVELKPATTICSQRRLTQTRRSHETCTQFAWMHEAIYCGTSACGSHGTPHRIFCEWCITETQAPRQQTSWFIEGTESTGLICRCSDTRYSLTWHTHTRTTYQLVGDEQTGPISRHCETDSQSLTRLVARGPQHAVGNTPWLPRHLDF